MAKVFVWSHRQSPFSKFFFPHTFHFNFLEFLLEFIVCFFLPFTLILIITQRVQHVVCLFFRMASNHKLSVHVSCFAGFFFVLLFWSTLPASPATCSYCLSRGWECLWSDAHRWSIYDPSAPIMNVFPRQKHSSLSRTNSQFRDIQCLTINSTQTKTERNRRRILFFRCLCEFVVLLQCFSVCGFLGIVGSVISSAHQVIIEL